MRLGLIVLLLLLYLEEVTDVDDEAVWAGFDGDPFVVNVNLQAGDLVLVQNGEQVRVGVCS